MKKTPATVFLGVGSNLGDREKHIREAVSCLSRHPGIETIKVSGLYETAPLYLTDQPSFLNCVFELSTVIAPEELLKVLKEIEKDLGRKRGRPCGPRVIDLDILFYGRRVIVKPDLKVPHPCLQERRFVLQPLCDLNPAWEHPLLKKSVRQLLEELGEDQEVSYLKQFTTLF